MSILTLQTEILEIIHPLGVHELHVLTRGSSIGVAQVALQGYVIVLHRSTGEPVLVKAGREASLLRRRVDQRVVQAADQLVRDPFEGPRSQTDVL